MLSHFPVSPLQAPYPLFPPLYRGLSHLLSHSCHSGLVFSYPGSSNIHRTKAFPFQWCQKSQSSATYPARAMGNPCVLFGWWFSPWEFGAGSLGALVGWYCFSSYEVANPFSFYSPCPNFSIRVPDLSPMLGCEYLPLCWSGSDRASPGIAISGSCQLALLGISNSVWVWC